MASDDDLRATDHTGLRVMELDDCLERLTRAPLGRLGFVLDGELCILPVNHTVDGVDICFRTSGDSKLEAASDHDRVAYEVDEFDPATRTGWSVLVQGTAVIVTEQDELDRLEGSAARPWVPPAPGRLLVGAGPHPEHHWSRAGLTGWPATNTAACVRRSIPSFANTDVT